MKVGDGRTASEERGLGWWSTAIVHPMSNSSCVQPPAGEAGLLRLLLKGRVVQSHEGVQKFLVEPDGGGASGVGGDALVVTGNHATR